MPWGDQKEMGNPPIFLEDFTIDFMTSGQGGNDMKKTVSRLLALALTAALAAAAEEHRKAKTAAQEVLQKQQRAKSPTCIFQDC